MCFSLNKWNLLKKSCESIDVSCKVLRIECDVILSRYFHLFSQRVSRLHDLTASLREYSIQIRDLYQSQLDIRQNRIMALLTIITSIFMPLTLIAGWYGMNFNSMPEFAWKYGYIYVIALSVAVVAVLMIYAKKKKWF